MVCKLLNINGLLSLFGININNICWWWSWGERERERDQIERERKREMRTGYRANRGVHSPPNVTMGGPIASQPIPPPGNEVLSYSVKVLYYDIGDG
jgi:hypothetical protein